jgi:hypothetical protein
MPNVLAAYFCKICIRLAASRMQISFSRPPAGCKYNSVGRQPDANCIQLAARRMQISFSRPPAEYKLHLASGLAIQNTQPLFINSLHLAGDEPNEICIQLVAR